MFETVKRLFAKTEEPRDGLRPIRRRLILRGLRFTFWHYLPSPYLDVRTRFVWITVNNFVFWLIAFMLVGFGPVKVLFAAATLAILQTTPFFLNILMQTVILDRRHSTFIPPSLSNFLRSLRLSATFAVLLSYFFSFLATCAGLSFYLGRQDAVAFGSWVVGGVENYLIKHPYVSISFVFARAALTILDIFVSFNRPMPYIKKGPLMARYFLLSFLPIILLTPFGIYFFKVKPSLAVLTLMMVGLQGLVGPPLLLAIMVDALRFRGDLLHDVEPDSSPRQRPRADHAGGHDSVPQLGQLATRQQAGLVVARGRDVPRLPPAHLITRGLEVGRYQGRDVYERLDSRGSVYGEALVEQSEAAGLALDDATREALRAGLAGATPLAPLDFPVVMLKNVARWVVFVFLTPATVFLFILILFNMIMGDELLTNWLANSSTPAPLTFMGVVISPYTYIRVKAAIFLALLSAGSTIVTLFNSREELAAFIKEEFVKDIRLDKHLLALYRSAELGFEIIASSRAEGKEVLAAAAD